MRINTLFDVAEAQLCCGCGACAFAAPDKIEMKQVANHGIRPFPKSAGEEAGSNDYDLRTAFLICPGIELPKAQKPEGHIESLYLHWGPVLELWEGYATDDALRFRASSGGIASALAAYFIEEKLADGVIHTRMKPDKPLQNETVFSRDKESIYSAAGSRYAPASPCEGLSYLRDHSGIFIGKPCDNAAVTMAKQIIPDVAKNLKLSISIFCAGTPSLNGTKEMLKRMNADESSLIDLRYRGHGWPGEATAVWKTSDGRKESKLTYQESWGEVLQKHRSWRCYICPDRTGEQADISVGDAWHRKHESTDIGRSLIVVRSEAGRKALRSACEAGYIAAEPAAHDALDLSQPSLRQARAKIWPRQFVCGLLGLARPEFLGVNLLRVWREELSWKDKIRTILGAFKAIRKNKLREPVELIPEGAEESIQERW